MNVETRISRSSVMKLREPDADTRYVENINYVSRGLYGRTHMVNGKYKEDQVFGYDGVLPLYNGKTVSEHIDKSLKRRVRRLRILDVGCGRGEFLLDVKYEWGWRVKPAGVSLHDLTDKSFSDNTTDDLLSRPTRSDLKKAKIPIVIGDAHRLGSALRRGGVSSGFDVIVSAYTFLYLADPLAAFKEIYRSLKIGGVAFIDSDPTIWTMSREEGEGLKGYLAKEYGIEFGVSGYGAAFKKEKPNIHLPVQYDISSEEDKLRYKLK